jgi:hypothetical protein
MRDNRGYWPVFSVAGVAHRNKYPPQESFRWYDYAACGLQAYYSEYTRRDRLSTDWSTRWEDEARPVMDDAAPREVTCLMCLVTGEAEE